MQKSQLARDGLRKRGVAAKSGAVNSSSAQPNGASARLSGLAAEYGNYDGLGLAKLIADKQISSLELLRAVRQRVETLNPKLNALCHLFFENAEAQINECPEKSPFRGVPFVLKDLGQYLTGTVTSAGSRIWENKVADSDSTLVTRYKQAGLVIFGKTTSPELGLTVTTESILFGQTHNPWNLDRTSGGSSGGAGVVVASRIVPMAHGSDGAGSIRVPASCCGVFGFKPTRGRVPMGPAQFEGWNGCSHHHALTISVRDSAALLDVSAGAELGSPYFSPSPARPFIEEVDADPGQLRIAAVTVTPNGTPLDPECKTAALNASKLCESLGHRIEEATLPIGNVMLSEALVTVVQVSVARVLDDAATTLGRPVDEQDVEPVTWAMMQAGMKVTSVTYSRAIATLHQIGLAMAKIHQSYDIILSPTLAKPPVPLGALSLSRSTVSWWKEITEFSPFTAPYNATGQPSMSVPLHWTPDGLPIGVLFSAPFGQDATLFRLAAQLERAQPWAGRRPPV